MDEMKSKKKRLSVTLDPDIIAKLAKLADEDDRSLSQFLNIILKNYLAEHEKSKSVE